jgi:elongation factor P
MNSALSPFMANTPVINLRRGMAVRHNNDVCIVTATELKTPPRMASYVQMSIRSIASGAVRNLRMTSNESLDLVNLQREPHELSYQDSDGYHFIHPTTFEDVLVGDDIIGDIKAYLIEGEKYNLVFCDDVIAAVDLPPSNVYKSVVMEGGLSVNVPLFIGPGEKISVKTEDGSYLGRA